MFVFNKEVAMFDESRDVWSIVPLEYDVFIGMDVDKRSIALTSLEHAQQIDSIKMANKADMVIGYAKKKFPGKRIVFTYEAGPTGFGLYDKLTDAGYKCLVTNPASVPTASNSRVKTNRVDSVKLAKTLRGGELKSVRVPTGRYRQLRHIVKLYYITVKQRTACKQRIKALLLLEGIAYPNMTRYDHWSNNTIKRLEALECNESVRFKLDMLIEDLQFHRGQLLKVNRKLRSFCKDDTEIADSVKYLTSIPGIGKTIAVHLIARIGDWRNLKNVRELGGFIGLTPCENSTGDKIDRGNITRLGDKRLRNMLIEGAWTAVFRDPEMGEFYQRICSRHPKDRASRKAVVAVARKMTTRIYRVLKDRREFVIRDVNYKSGNIEFNKKRRLNAPEDDSTLRRTIKDTGDSPVTYGFVAEIETSGRLLP